MAVKTVIFQISANFLCISLFASLQYDQRQIFKRIDTFYTVILEGFMKKERICLAGGPLRAFAHNETPDGISGTKGAYYSEIAGSQIPIVQVKGDQ